MTDLQNKATSGRKETPPPESSPAPTLSKESGLGLLRALIARPFLLALIAGALVGVLVTGFSLLSPAQYEARLGLLATPVVSTGESRIDYSAVVSLALPSVIEAARSPAVLESVKEAVSGAPDIADLRDSVTMSIVPASGLVRLSTSSGDPVEAAQLATAFAEAVMESDLLAPVGRLRPVGDRPTVTRVAPDEKLAAGFGIAAGLVVALSVLGAARILAPSRKQVIQAAMARVGVRRPVALLSGTHDELVRRLILLQAGAGKPLRILPASSSATGSARQLGESLTKAAVPLAGNEASLSAVVLVGDADSSADDYASMLGAVGADGLVGIVLG